MYASAADYLGLNDLPPPKLVRGRINLPNGISRKDYGGYLTNENYTNTPKDEKYDQNADMTDAQDEKQETPVNKWIRNFPSFTPDPKSWGPFFWTTYHVSAAYYPVDPAPIVKNSIKARILAIPYEIPCNKCRHHASAFIQSYDLDKAVSTRDELIKFYVEFHNKVNKRYGKPEWTVEQAKQKYGGESRMT